MMCFSLTALTMIVCGYVLVETLCQASGCSRSQVLSRFRTMPSALLCDSALASRPFRVTCLDAASVNTAKVMHGTLSPARLFAVAQ